MKINPHENEEDTFFKWPFIKCPHYPAFPSFGHAPCIVLCRIVTKPESVRFPAEWYFFSQKVVKCQFYIRSEKKQQQKQQQQKQ